ncbi:MAG: SpoIIE family protein phosphatase [Lentisphaeria bacterium]
MELKNFHVELECAQITKDGEAACGDSFVAKVLRNEKRYLAILSDGLGSGIKANILSGLTVTMALKFFSEDLDIKTAATIIMDTLPVCDERKISYSTFTVVDIRFDGHTRIIEMDNPAFLHWRSGQFLDHLKEEIISAQWPQRRMFISEFRLAPQDRIVFFSDGVTQAGIGTNEFTNGFGQEKCANFIANKIQNDLEISAIDLANSVIKKAKAISYNQQCCDDISCAVAYFRKPRQILLVSGPPFYEENDSILARQVAEFSGKKVICGGTTAIIISRELKRKIELNLDSNHLNYPPTSTIEGIDLVTEGILTLTETAKALEENLRPKNPAALQLKNMLLNSDIITLLIGTKVNQAHQDPNLTVELEIRRSIIKRIILALEKNYNKEVNCHYF